MPEALFGELYSTFDFNGDVLFLFEKSFNLVCNKSKLGLLI